MNEALSLLLGSVAGLALGAVFFGGLWWTVRRAVSAQQPALWLFGSALARMAVALGGFLAVSSGDWRRLVACLAGFVVARPVVVWLTRPAAEQAVHAP